MSLQGTGNLQREKARLLRARETGRKDRVEGTLGEAQPCRLFSQDLFFMGHLPVQALLQVQVIQQ